MTEKAGGEAGEKIVEEEHITLPREAEVPERTLAQMLRAQYLSKDMETVFSATELREHEVMCMADLFMARLIPMILSTTEAQLKGLEGEDRKLIEERLKIKQLILTDTNAMAFVIEDAWLYAFGLCRQSLKRQSRKEAIAISMGPRMGTVSRDVGLLSSIAAKLGISRRYRTTYESKEPEV